MRCLGGNGRHDVVISVRLSAEEERILRGESERQGIPMSTLARRAISRQYGRTTPIQMLTKSSTSSTTTTVQKAFGAHALQQASDATLQPIARPRS